MFGLNSFEIGVICVLAALIGLSLIWSTWAERHHYTEQTKLTDVKTAFVVSDIALKTAIIDSRTLSYRKQMEFKNMVEEHLTTVVGQQALRAAYQRCIAEGYRLEFYEQLLFQLSGGQSEVLKKLGMDDADIKRLTAERNLDFDSAVRYQAIEDERRKKMEE